MTSLFDRGLERQAANHQPLTPLTFLSRAAAVFPERVAIAHGETERTYAAFHQRCRQLGSALGQAGIGRGDVVAALFPNVPAMLEAHYAVPMAGAVLNAINTRLDPASIRFILEHGEAKIVLVDSEFSERLEHALEGMAKPPRIIETVDDQWQNASPPRFGNTYEAFVAEGATDFAPMLPDDEWDAISLNYTSGTTGAPKGVVYSHRGAYLMCLSNALAVELGRHPVYLWTLPMFHCNGWCFPWSLAAVAGTHVCLRHVRGDAICQAIARHRVTHLCGAPIVMQTILSGACTERPLFSDPVAFVTAAAPPPESVLAAMASAGFKVVHVYGLTEVYGPAVVNEWKNDWDGLPAAERAMMMARQGVAYPALEGLAVMDPASMTPVPADGTTLGEVMFRGNIVMKGYFKNQAATDQAFAGGWFHSGDLAVVHPDGYIQLKDRSKDIIISGGENISSIEVEEALTKHPAVRAVAVVAQPDETWGETPCAFVELEDEETVATDALLAFARRHLAAYKLPKRIVFGPLPKTATGKVQKFVLRQRSRED